jgi:hypothetical protein
MDGILVIPRLFKYAKTEIAITILEKKTLKWSNPDLFNDPFEFKSPLEYGFEWDEMMEIALQRFGTILTRIEDPILAIGHLMAPTIARLREQWKGRDPTEASRQWDAGFKTLAQKFKDQAASDAKTWFEMKQTYRVLCLSAVHDHILMWSHYADNHRGVVLEFRPMIFARPVVYSTEVPVAASLQEYVGWLTGERLKPDASDGFEKSVYTKSSVWAYENEWRVLDKRSSDKEPFFYRDFHPQELVAVYFGCRISPEGRKRMMGIVAGWESPVSLFQMRDERIRFELTAEPIM